MNFRLYTIYHMPEQLALKIIFMLNFFREGSIYFQCPAKLSRLTDWYFRNKSERTNKKFSKRKG